MATQAPTKQQIKDFFATWSADYGVLMRDLPVVIRKTNKQLIIRELPTITKLLTAWYAVYIQPIYAFNKADKPDITAPTNAKSWVGSLGALRSQLPGIMNSLHVNPQIINSAMKELDKIYKVYLAQLTKL